MAGGARPSLPAAVPLFVGERRARLFAPARFAFSSRLSRATLFGESMYHNLKLFALRRHTHPERRLLLPRGSTTRRDAPPARNTKMCDSSSLRAATAATTLRVESVGTGVASSMRPILRPSGTGAERGLAAGTGALGLVPTRRAHLDVQRRHAEPCTAPRSRGEHRRVGDASSRSAFTFMPPVRSEEKREETVSEESEESAVRERRGVCPHTGFRARTCASRAPDARSFGARRRASSADARRTSHADDGFLAREIRDVLRVGQGVARRSSEGGSRRFHGKSSSRVWTPNKAGSRRCT